MVTQRAPSSDDFLDLYHRGRFTGILRWPQLDHFWDVLRSQAEKGWYIYAVGEEVPHAPASKSQVLKFIDEIDALLHREHAEDYCGIVYADDLSKPTFVKIFDPNNLGSSCGSSKNPPKPGWIMSLQRPVVLADSSVVPNNRKRWWKGLFSRR